MMTWSVNEITKEKLLGTEKPFKTLKPPTFFQKKEWLLLWLNYFAPETLFLQVADEKRKPFGIFPFEKKAGIVGFLGTGKVLGGQTLTDYADCITTPGLEERLWLTVLDYLSKNRRILGIDRLEFSYLREDSLSYPVLEKLNFEKQHIETSLHINLPKTWNDYLKSLNRHNRHELKRKIKRIFRSEALLEESDGSEKDRHDFYNQVRLSSLEKEKFMTGRMEGFFDGIISGFLPKGEAVLLFLNVAGVRIASSLALKFNKELYYYNSGFDIKYKPFSPGVVLKGLAIEKAIKEGYKTFDFLRGTEKYKYAFTNNEIKLYSFRRKA